MVSSSSLVASRPSTRYRVTRFALVGTAAKYKAPVSLCITRPSLTQVNQGAFPAGASPVLASRTFEYVSGPATVTVMRWSRVTRPKRGFKGTPERPPLFILCSPSRRTVARRPARIFVVSITRKESHVPISLSPTFSNNFYPSHSHFPRRVKPKSKKKLSSKKCTKNCQAQKSCKNRGLRFLQLSFSNKLARSLLA